MSDMKCSKCGQPATVRTNVGAIAGGPDRWEARCAAHAAFQPNAAQTEQLRNLSIVLNRYQDICDILDEADSSPNSKLNRIADANDQLGKALVAAHPHLSGETGETRCCPVCSQH